MKSALPQITHLSQERGWQRGTCNLLKDQKQIGRYKDKFGNDCWAFPNIDCDGDIRSIRYRVPPKAVGEKPRWYFDPTGSKRHALVWGDRLRAARIAIHENQWDAGTHADKLARYSAK